MKFRCQGAISIDITTTSPTCFNHIGVAGGTTGNGVILATASGGTPPYVYALQSLTAKQNIGYFPGLNEGTYIVEVTDATGQRTTQQVILINTLPQPLLQTDIWTLPSSCTSTDGSLELVPSGGAPPYTYSLDGGSTFQPISPILTNLPQGYYTFYCKDANGCLSAAITTGSSLNFNYFFNPQCTMQISGETSTACTNDGTLNVWVLFGTAPFQYSLDGITYVPSNNGDQFLLTNIAPGFYHIHAKDATGNIAETLFTISKTCYTEITFVGIDASCGQNDGSLTVTAGYGTPPYTYTIDGVNFQSSNVFTGLASGGYTISARDASGEIGSAVTQIYDKCPTVSAVATDEVCSQVNGTITATGSKGTVPYQFSIDGINFQTSNIFRNLAFGQYVVVVRDANGFTGSTLTYVNNECIQLSITPVNTTCGFKNGSLTINASNGVVPYQFSIDGQNYQQNNVFVNLAAGTFTVTVKDATGLVNTVSSTITDTPGPQIDITTSPASCDNTNGLIKISSNGVSLPLMYSVDSGITFQPANIFNNLDSGLYNVIVRDAIGCTASETIRLTAPPTPFFTLGNDTTLCAGQSLILNNPSSAGYQYQWQDNSTNSYYLIIHPGVYDLKITNQFGCSFKSAIDVNFSPLPIFDIGNDTTVCAGKSLQLKPVPTIAGSYLWNTGSNANSIAVNSAGVYSLQITKNGCATTKNVKVTYKPAPVISLGEDTTLCEGQTLLLDVTNDNSVYTWQDGSGQSSLAVNQTGVYSVKVDENGCDTSGSVKVNFITKPVINIGNDTVLCFTQKLLLDAAYTQSTYLWQDSSSSSQYEVTKEGTYSVEVTNACGDTKNTLKVSYENFACRFFVPNGFTPNNDGVNDVFRPRNECLFGNYELKVFNRWGQLVFKSDNTSIGWDGSFKNQQQPSGTYVWMISYTDNLTGKPVYKSGSVILIR